MNASRELSKPHAANNVSEILLVPDLPSEGWPSMDRYASRLTTELELRANDSFRFRTSAPPVEPGSSSTAGSGELRRYASRYATYPRRVRRLDCDLVHILDHSYAHIRHGGKPHVVTVHDMSVLHTQETGSGLRPAIRNFFLRRVLEGIRRADAFIVSTRAIREELAAFLGSGTHINVVPYGVDDTFSQVSDEEKHAIRERLGASPPHRIILHVGSAIPRKRLPLALEVAAKLRAEDDRIQFWQLGAERPPGTPEVPGVRRFGKVTEQTLLDVYRAADVLLFPSSYEGFGLPVLEAMACGLPVVTSGRAGLADLIGDAATVPPSDDADGYSKAIRDLLDDGARYIASRDLGVRRAAHYTWRAMAEKTAEVYTEVLARCAA